MSKQTADSGQLTAPEREMEKRRWFPVTDGELDAPDGAVVDGYERVRDRWVWVEGEMQNAAEWAASRRTW